MADSSRSGRAGRRRFEAAAIGDSDGEPRGLTWRPAAAKYEFK